MHPIQLFINIAGLKTVSDDWKLEPINTQRLYIILGGRGNWKYRDDCIHTFESGMLYIFPLNLEPQFISDKTAPLEHIFFDFQTSPPIISDDPIMFKIDDSIELKLLCDYVTAKMRTISGVEVEARYHIDMINPKNPLFRDMNIELTRMLELLLLQCDELTELPFSRDTAIADAVMKIHREFSNRLSVKQLAAEFGYVPAHFIRRFERVIGKTPYTYIRSLKLNRARELLSYGYTLTEAALEVGYESASSLSHALAKSVT